MIEGHGDDLYRYGGKVKYNFSSNVHSDVDHSKLMRHLSSLGERLKSYPEPEAGSLEKHIAARTGVSPDEVLVTNGATEAIYLIAMSLRGSNAQIMAPAFREYQDACRIHGVGVEFISGLRQIAPEASSLWLCNPANPTGIVTDRVTIENALMAHQDKLFVIDQAYAAYSVKPVLSRQEAVAAGNVIMLSSLTKDFAVPGLRIGYAVGAAHLLSTLRRLRMPWSVNALAIEAAGYLLEHADDYKINAALLHDGALEIAASFSEMGITVKPSDCNFILCRLPDSNEEGDHLSAAALKEFLIDNYGILIRDASNFEGLDSRHFRVAAQSPEANSLLCEAVADFMAHHS